MNCIYQTINDRMDIIKEVNSALKLVQQQQNQQNLSIFRQNVIQMRKHELLLQEIEDKCLQKISKEEFSSVGFRRFNNVMYNIITRMFPKMTNLSRIEQDGKPHTIRNLFYLLYRTLNLSDKMNEVQQINTKSLIPVLTKSLIYIQRKMVGDKFRTFNLLNSNSQKLENNNQPNKRISRLNTLKKFQLSQHIQAVSPDRAQQKQNAFRQITNVLNNTVIQDVPSTLYCATVKYQDLLARNKSVKTSLDSLSSQQLSSSFQFCFYNKIKEEEEPKPKCKGGKVVKSKIQTPKLRPTTSLINSFRISKIK